MRLRAFEGGQQIYSSRIEASEKAADLAGKEGEGAALGLEDVDDAVDERAVGRLLQVCLEADVGALHLRGHMHCKIGIALRGEGGSDGVKVVTGPTSQRWGIHCYKYV